MAPWRHAPRDPTPVCSWWETNSIRNFPGEYAMVCRAFFLSDWRSKLRCWAEVLPAPVYASQTASSACITSEDGELKGAACTQIAIQVSLKCLFLRRARVPCCWGQRCEVGSASRNTVQSLLSRILRFKNALHPSALAGPTSYHGHRTGFFFQFR